MESSWAKPNEGLVTRAREEERQRLPAVHLKNYYHFLQFLKTSFLATPASADAVVPFLNGIITSLDLVHDVQGEVHLLQLVGQLQQLPVAVANLRFEMLLDAAIYQGHLLLQLGEVRADPRCTIQPERRKYLLKRTKRQNLHLVEKSQ